MRPLSASECVSPAIERTRLVLFSPFRAGRTWKLCATASLARYGTIFLPVPLVYLAFLPAAYRAAGTPGVLALVGAVVFFTALFVYLFHLYSRLQFVSFDLVLNRGEFVRPAWRRYRAQALRFTGLKLVLGCAVSVAVALPMAAYIRRVLPLFVEMRSLGPHQPPTPQLFAAIFAGYGVIFLTVGLFYLFSSLLWDFVLPSLAMEDTSLREAFRRMMELARGEPGEFALYTLLKVGMGLAFSLAAFLAFELAFLIITILLGLLVFGIGYALHLANVPVPVLTVAGITVMVVWYLLAVGYGVFLINGLVVTFLEAYSIYFLAGRYPAMAEPLERSTPPPAPNPYLGAYAPPYPPLPPPA